MCIGEELEDYFERLEDQEQARKHRLAKEETGKLRRVFRELKNFFVKRQDKKSKPVNPTIVRGKTWNF